MTVAKKKQAAVAALLKEAESLKPIIPEEKLNKIVKSV